MTDRDPRPGYPAGDGPRDPDRSTGPDQAGRAAGPTAGHGSRNDDAELGLGGTGFDTPPTEMAAGGNQDPVDPAGETGLEIGNSTLGSSTNAAERVDTFNVPPSDDREPR